MIQSSFYNALSDNQCSQKNRRNHLDSERCVRTMDQYQTPTYQYRIVVIGDVMTGKSTLIATYVSEKFRLSSKATIGFDIFYKTVELEKGTKIRLQIWDTAGQERFKAMTQSYYRRSLGVILVYDVTERSSFDHLVDWLHNAERYAHNVVFQLVACKCDLNEKDRKVDAEEAKAFADFYKIEYIETSAKELYNVEKAFKTIIKAINAKVEKGELRAERINLPSVSSASDISTDQKTERGICQVC